jgi:hypothetical protein
MWLHGLHDIMFQDAPLILAFQAPLNLPALMTSKELRETRVLTMS